MATIRRIFIIISAATVCSPLFCDAATAGELDARMTKVAKTFTRSASETGLSTATLTVMPFKTDKKLAENGWITPAARS